MEQLATELERQLKNLEGQAAKKALEKEKGRALKGKDQKSFADHEALPMAKPKDGFMYGYNCQAAVDEKRQIIVAAEVHDSAADCGALNSMVEKVQENGSEFPGAVFKRQNKELYFIALCLELFLPMRGIRVWII